MRTSVNKKDIVSILIFVASIFLIFNNIPNILQFQFLSGGFSNKLSFYPLLILMVYTLYCYKINYVQLSGEKCFTKYIELYLGIALLTTILGLIYYPYFQEILSGPGNQIEKLPGILAFFKQHGMDIDEKIMMSCWMIARMIKEIFFEVLYTFGFTYIIYCWYKNNWRDGLHLFSNGAMVSLVICIAYSVVEIFYLSGSGLATGILETITPYIHAVKTQVNWWPPLLWPNQLRSVFPEPSHVGNYAAYVLPVLWCGILKSHTVINRYSVCTFLFSCMIFLTKARTANGMFFGMLFLFLLTSFYFYRNYAYKKIVIIIFCSMIAFGCSIGLLNMQQNVKGVSNSPQVVTMESFMDDNVGSLATQNKRSNGARYALIKSNLRVWSEHPMLGVGNGLASAYIADYFTEREKKDQEVAMWLSYIQKNGYLKYSLGAMNEYVDRLTQTGVIGLLVFCMPFLYVLYKMFLIIKRRIRNQKDSMDMYMCFLALIGNLVAGMNGSLNLNYAIWIILGFAYAAILNEENEKFLHSSI